MQLNKTQIIKDTFLSGLRSDFIDTIIVRCDAGASRSQAITTALSRAYNVKLEGYNAIGNIDILQKFEKFLGINKDEEFYEKLYNEKLENLEPFLEK